MAIGQKIMKLRGEIGLSQEELAEKLDVSRQTVSKWELDQALPQIDKIIFLAQFFGVSTDYLLIDEVELEDKKSNISSGKYFGTDGFRGEANTELTSMHAYKVGRFIGWYYSQKSPTKRARVVIGKDTRRSSYMLEYSISAGIAASGADVYLLHVTTTPSVSYVTRQEEFDCGIMITASHNPYYDNGIKIINKFGEKLDDETTALIEAYIDGNLKAIGIQEDDIPFAKKDKIGSITDYISGRNRYIGYLISLASNSYKNLRIGLDCANGASWNIAKTVFDALGAQLYVIGAEPDGLNVNYQCGSTHIEKLVKLVKENHLDVGFAFDGDADRCLAVDGNGNVVNGDHILYILGNIMKKNGELVNNTVVTTIMSNLGLYRALEEAGMDYVQTTVGDRYVYENMLETGNCVGGEQSGHIIMSKYATTGDGILTAIKVMEAVIESKLPIEKLAEPVKMFPQVLKNVRVQNKKAVREDTAVQELVAQIGRELGGDGRILLRESGTEPVVRVMAEAATEELCEKCVDRVVDMIHQRGLA